MPTPEDKLIALGCQKLVRGQRDQAMECLRRAVAVAPGNGAAYGLFGEALRVQALNDAAAVQIRRAVRVSPADASRLCALAIVQLRRRRLGEALPLARRALALDPAFAQAWSWIGQIEKVINAGANAVKSAGRAVRLAPSDLGALNAYGRVLTNDDKARGDRDGTLRGLGALQKALTLAPTDPTTLENLASAGIRLGLYDHAVLFVRRMMILKLFNAGAFSQLAIIALMQGRFKEAIALGQNAAILAPDRPGAWINLGLGFQSRREMERARACYKRALVVEPGSAVGNLNLAIVELHLGEYTTGWKHFEARWFTGAQFLPKQAPLWQGEDPAGLRILVVAEQGQGDTLHFIRYAKGLSDRGAEVTALVPSSLKRLLQRTPGVAATVAISDDTPPPPVDRAVAMMSLPRVFRTTVDTIPADIPYLFASPEDRALWQERVQALPGLRVGLVWAGDAHVKQMHAYAANQRRSVKLADLAPLAAIPGISWVSLQKGKPAIEAKTPPPGMILHDWMEEARDFADTAGLADQLDLVITVDTSVAHLAGGLGRPTWMLSRYDGCWRWLLDRDDTPWYPTMRLFRQASPGDWPPVIAQVAAALEQDRDTLIAGR